MSIAEVEVLRELLGERLLGSSSFRGDETVRVAAGDWFAAATLLRDEPRLRMNHFIDLTAVDYPEREERFDLCLFLRSHLTNRRIRLVTSVAEGQSVDSLCPLWSGANWAEREVYDMFGVRFRGHPDLRRILLYEEFEGHPLRKDYPIDRTQPLVPYREVEDIGKLPPFGLEEGQPWSRIQWGERLQGRDRQVSPAIALQTGQRRALTQSDAFPKAGDKAEAGPDAASSGTPSPSPSGGGD